MSNRIFKIHLYVQVLLWILCSAKIFELLLLKGSNDYLPYLVFGLSLQVFGIVHTTISTKFNPRWLGLILTSAILNFVMYLDGQHILDTHFFDNMSVVILSIAATNILYGLSGIQIINEIRRS